MRELPARRETVTHVLDFELPKERIALQPMASRDASKLLVFERTSKKIVHTNFRELSSFLRAGDTLVFNDALVNPVRIAWTKPTGGACELLLLRCLRSQPDESIWEALVSGRNLRERRSYALGNDLEFRIQRRLEAGRAEIILNRTREASEVWLSQFGLMPIPPYIRKARTRARMSEDSSEDESCYQTVFAHKGGAVAAPTAGLHFTKELLEALQGAGVATAFLNLRVGWGTFQEVTEAQWRSGKLHAEWVEVPPTVSEIIRGRPTGSRICAVGTTVVRALEYWHLRGEAIAGVEGWCDLFLHQPWRSNVSDALITNFHLPRSSLLCLVSAFLGPDGDREILELYREAIRQEYRFYSYGDAMLIL